MGEREVTPDAVHHEELVLGHGRVDAAGFDVQVVLAIFSSPSTVCTQSPGWRSAP